MLVSVSATLGLWMSGASLASTTVAVMVWLVVWPPVSAARTVTT